MGFRDRLRLLDPPDDDAEFVAADAADDVGGAHVADQFTRDRLEQRVAGSMAVAVVDPLEAVEIDEHQGGLRSVALHMRERPLELALETAPVENIEQRIDVRPRLKLADAGARDRQFALQALVLGKQRRKRRKLIVNAWLRKSHDASSLANLNCPAKNTPFALPVGGLDL